MPVYDYLCNDCGPFTDMRPMAECDEPQDCPRCAAEAPRAFLTAPNFFCMSSDKRKAHATNRAQLQRAENPRPVQGLAWRGLRVLFGQAVASGHQDPERRQEFPDRASMDDQPLKLVEIRLNHCGDGSALPLPSGEGLG